MSEPPKPATHTTEPATPPRTPAYTTFDSNTDKLRCVLILVSGGVRGLHTHLETKVAPEVTTLCTEIAAINGPAIESAGLEAGKMDVGSQPLSDTSLQVQTVADRLSALIVKPVAEFADGLLAIRQWIPVMLVTIVEEYLKDVHIFAAQSDPEIMEKSEQTASYADVTNSLSIEDLKQEMQARWAKNVLDRGGPKYWLERFTRSGARDYRKDTVDVMELLWGVRHLVVHSAGITTAEFVRRHPSFAAKVGESIAIRSNHLQVWLEVVYDFVDVTDRHFLKRYGRMASG
jgi:hypothetical protein